ncbi:MAG: sigma-54 dependent transcriptional regulator [Desulfobulbaceae bacterium]|nr:sigma-54 dependent transcriptional regulator [Desulfobulbaceae bacterium]
MVNELRDLQQKRSKATLLLIGEENNFFRELKDILLANDFQVREKIFGGGYKDFPETALVDGVVVCSCQHDPLDGIFLLERMKSCAKEIPLFLVAQFGSEKKAIAALRSGATDYFSRSQVESELALRIKHHLHDSVAAFDLSSPSLSDISSSEPDFIGESVDIHEIRSYLMKLAKMSCNVLITGETGTGKELAANFIHWHSGRRGEPFVRMNSSAMSEKLIESELLGYEKGAFHGAETAKPGKFEEAENGILFLDEISDMSPFGQAEVLRIIENNTVHRLGGSRPHPVNVRIIATTNRNPDKMIESELFRKDLFFRLNVARVHLPPLRERKGDLPLLLKNFVRSLNHRFGFTVSGFSEKAWFSLLKYEWPGNVRELKNVLEATYISNPGQTITFRDLPKPFRRTFLGGDFRPKSERDQVLTALFATNWNKSQAAQKLNWSRMTLYRKMAKHQIVQNRSIRTQFADISQ